MQSVLDSVSLIPPGNPEVVRLQRSRNFWVSVFLCLFGVKVLEYIYLGEILDYSIARLGADVETVISVWLVLQLLVSCWVVKKILYCFAEFGVKVGEAKGWPDGIKVRILGPLGLLRFVCFTDLCKLYRAVVHEQLLPLMKKQAEESQRRGQLVMEIKALLDERQADEQLRAEVEDKLMRNHMSSGDLNGYLCNLRIRLPFPKRLELSSQSQAVEVADRPPANVVKVVNHARRRLEAVPVTDRQVTWEDLLQTMNRHFLEGRYTEAKQVGQDLVARIKAGKP